FRPGFLKPTKGAKNTMQYYRYVNWLFPVFRFILPKYVSTLSELGIAMINSSTKGYEKSILEVKDIVELAKI
ncbi:MAG: epimerase, partial [Bacteroidota bacterium]